MEQAGPLMRMRKIGPSVSSRGTRRRPPETRRMRKMSGPTMTISTVICEAMGQDTKRRLRLRPSRPPAEPFVDMRCAPYAAIALERARGRTHTHTAGES